MIQSPIEIISGREAIPEFVMKVYEILEKEEYQDIISWNADNNQIVIKDSLKLENIVLPNFFRHNKVRSFIRQLNMYRFKKVARYQKHEHMHFKHEHFKRGNIQSLVFIKRKKRNPDDSVASDTEQDVNQETLVKYKEFVRTNIELIQKDLAGLAKQNPQIAAGFRRPLQISNILIGKDMDYRLDILLEQFMEPCQDWLRVMKTIKEFDPHLSMDSLQPSQIEEGSSFDPIS